MDLMFETSFNQIKKMQKDIIKLGIKNNYDKKYYPDGDLA